MHSRDEEAFKSIEELISQAIQDLSISRERLEEAFRDLQIYLAGLVDHPTVSDSGESRKVELDMDGIASTLVKANAYKST